MGEAPPPAALGFSSHSGWAVVVCLGGSSPVLIERSRVLLTWAPLPREPYHDAKRRGPKEAEEIIADAAAEARALAAEAIKGMMDSARARGYQLIAGGVVLGGGRPDFTLAQALSTHAAMHGAEGWLFREALIEASQQCGLESVGVPQRELPARAAAALETSESAVGELMREIGRRCGPPWAQDQKVATMVALVALRSASERSQAPA